MLKVWQILHLLLTTWYTVHNYTCRWSHILSDLVTIHNIVVARYLAAWCKYATNIFLNMWLYWHSYTRNLKNQLNQPQISLQQLTLTLRSLKTNQNLMQGPMSILDDPRVWQYWHGISSGLVDHFSVVSKHIDMKPTLKEKANF